MAVHFSSIISYDEINDNTSNNFDRHTANSSSKIITYTLVIIPKVAT